MQVLVGRMSDEGRFASEAPVPGARMIQWTEPLSGGVRLCSEPGQTAERLPDKVAKCRAWSIELDSMQDLLKTMDDWRTDHAASARIEVRDRGQHGRTDGEQNIVMVLEDHEYEGHIFPCVVEVTLLEVESP